MEEEAAKKKKLEDDEANTRTKDCKNNDTFVLFDDIKDIPKKYFIKLENGFCYDIRELTDYVKSDDFRNKNPHQLSNDLININKDLTKLAPHPELLKAVMKYLKDQNSLEKQISKDIFENLDVLYAIGNAGRVLSFDQMYMSTALEENDSSAFDRSIKTLTTLSTFINSKPKHIKDVFMDKMKVPHLTTTLNKLLTSANKGHECIHGIGLKMCELFIYWFVTIENKYKIKYDVTLTRLLIKWNTTRLDLFDVSLKISPSETNDLWRFVKLILHTKNSSIVNYAENLKNMYTHYDETCAVDAEDVTLDNVEHWSDIEPWRIIKLQNYCYDIYFLSKYLISALNSSDYNNPKPVFPKNPYTIRNLTHDELKTIKHRLLFHDKLIPVQKKNPLHVFLMNEDLWNHSDTWFNTMLTELNKTMRFRKTGAVDSQNNFIGHWVLNRISRSKNEKNIDKYLTLLQTDPLAINLRKKIKYNKADDDTLNNKYFFNKI